MKVKTCSEKKKLDSGKVLYDVETECGKTGQAWELLAPGDEVTHKESEYNGKTQITFFKAKKAFVKSPRADNARASLSYAIKLIESGHVKIDKMYEAAEKMLSWLNERS